VNNMKRTEQAKTASGINVVAGVWLILSPYILGFAAISAALANSVITGIIIGVLALIRVYTPKTSASLSWINLILGVWLIAAPFILGITSMVAVWNSVILGIIVAAMAIWSATAVAEERHGHGHA